MTLWESLKIWWALYRRGVYPTTPISQDKHYQNIEQMLHTDLTGMVKRSIEKLRNQAGNGSRPKLWDVGTGEAKRREVVQWAKIYAEEFGIPKPSDWHINFMVEYLIGIEKGRI